MYEISVDGVMISDIPYLGRYWFEYSCWEDPRSGDAEIWYRSHKEVEVIGVADCDIVAGTLADRAEIGMQIIYRVRFDDGLEWDIFEDELVLSSEHFHRPDPPRK
jgi:hypothetical protein